MVLAGLFAVLLTANVPEMVIPEGTILPVILNETLNTKKVQEGDPILFSLAEDIRTAGRRGPVLLPRGSSVIGRIVGSKQAGHFIGRSHMDIRLQEIITPTGESYDGITTKIVDIAKKKGEKGEVRADGGIQGPVHRGRDAFFLLFPPTTLFQLLATPKRGPDIVLPVETRLYVKLMTPIYVETAPRVAAVTPAVPLPSAAVPAPAPYQVPVPVAVPQPIQAYSPVVTTNGLDILVSPVALYPDAILRDLFRASQRPFEVIQANIWVHQSRDAYGSLPANGYNDSWDQSVKALTAYPDLLQRLSADVDWMTRLGAVFNTQPVEVLNAVQRQRAQANSLQRSRVTYVATGR
jgi:uncharacterized protein DUF3300